MSLGNWIANNPDAVGVIVTVIGGYLWKRASGQKTEDIWETLQDLAMAELPNLLNDPHVTAVAHARIRRAILAGLARLNIKRSKLVDKLVDEAVEWGCARLAEKIMERSLDRFIKTSEKTVDILKSAPEDKPIDTTGQPVTP